jgi:hypothetical protein
MTPLLVRQHIVDLSQLSIELTHISATSSLNESCDVIVLITGLREIPIYDGINIGVTKRKYLLTRCKDNKNNFCTTKSAQFTGFLEEPNTAPRERHSQVALIANLFHLKLLTTWSLPSTRHGWITKREKRKLNGGCVFDLRKKNGTLKWGVNE